MNPVRFIERQYSTLYSQHGWFGVFFAAMALIIIAVAVWLYFDRR